jgi:hypothetical protein
MILLIQRYKTTNKHLLLILALFATTYTNFPILPKCSCILRNTIKVDGTFGQREEIHRGN